MEEVEQQPPTVTLNPSGIPEYEPIVVPPAPEEASSFDSNGPRLIISHIVNENFKSYAGTQTLGPFHKSFTSIVGPNGSGKSNVIDSMLFVFGYRANKIRSKKISVLIHSSEMHQNIDSCTVSVHFQKIIDEGPGENEYSVVPGSKFVVSRTAFKDSSSYYRVNDKKVQYKEVAALLRGCGIDLDHNRFLILQGEVEQIAMMKPKSLTENEDGMLEFLEDIIGSSRFKIPIDQLAKRVEELNELRSEKLNRVKAVEKEKDGLEGAKNEAVEFLQTENEIYRKKNMLYQKYLFECTEGEQKANEKREEVAVEMKELDQKLNEITDKKKEKAKDSKKTIKKFDDLSKECDSKKDEFGKFEQQDVRCREDIKHAHVKKKKLEKSLEQEEKKLEELKLIPEKQERDAAELKKKLDKLQTDKEKEEENLKAVMESFKSETADLQKEKEKKESELLGLQKSVNETKSQYTVTQSELDLYKSNQAKETAKLTETQRNIERAANTLKERRSTLDDLNKRLPEASQALEKAKKDLNEVTTTESKKAEQVRQMRVKVEEARSSMQAAHSQGRVLESLMNQKRNGQLPGIYGRLGDLGAIDEKYNVAISTACGALDNIVVDNMNTGQKCVEFLKKNGVGLATFVGLDKMEKWKDQCNRRFQAPENVPRLFDLIKVNDPSLRPAFYFAVRDTLVAKDLEQATRIAYGAVRYRVVTLNGQLIDTSGTMSGGGTRVCRGKMGSTVITDVDPKVVEEWENQLEKGTREALSCRENRTKLEEMIDKLQKSHREMTHSQQKLNLEIKSLEDQTVSLQKQEKDQVVKVKASAPDEKKLKEIEKKVETFKKEYEKAQAVSSKVEDEVHRIHKQIMDIGGTKLKAVESRLALINSQVDQLTGLLTKANVAIKTAERNSKKTEEKIASMKTELVENQQKLESCEQELKQLDVDATAVLNDYKKAQEAMKEVETALAEVNSVIAKLDEEETELRKQHIEVKHKFEKFDAVVKENKDKIKHWKKELDKLSLHQINDGDKEELQTLTTEELNAVDTKNTQYLITVEEEKLVKMKPNMAAIAEYRKKEEMYLKRVSELDQITDLRNQQRKQHEDLRKQRLDEFMCGFSQITNKLKEMYQMITLGGDAELELVDSLDPFSEGIVFSVRPPKKSWKNISNLSGGEKTLSSLALVFALHHYKPTPLYVMDEIDAALDFRNVSIVANYIKERTKNAQFIIISLRNNMFELADRLVGIYKTYNCTKSVTINPHSISLLSDLDEQNQPPVN